MPPHEVYQRASVELAVLHALDKGVPLLLVEMNSSSSWVIAVANGNDAVLLSHSDAVGLFPCEGGDLEVFVLQYWYGASRIRYHIKPPNKEH